MLLTSVSYKTSAQGIDLSYAVRKANESKQRLDSCKADGLIVTVQRNAYMDSTSDRNGTIKKLKKANKRLQNRGDNWQKATGVTLLITILSILL